MDAVDEGLSADWVAHVMVDGLQSARSSVHARRVVRGLAGRTKLTALLDTLTGRVHGEVQDAISEAKRDRCRFSIQIDGWKSKTRRVKHYGATLLTWCTRSWLRRQACIHVARLKGKRDGEKYRDICLTALDKVGLTPDDIIASLSDHEGAVRRGLVLLGGNSVGCGCHAMQLAVKHALPPTEATKGTEGAAGTGRHPSHLLFWIIKLIGIVTIVVV